MAVAVDPRCDVCCSPRGLCYACIRSVYNKAIELCLYDIKCSQLFDGLIALEESQVRWRCLC